MENQTYDSNSRNRTNLDHCKNSPGFKEYATYLDAMPRDHYMKDLAKASKNWFPTSAKRRAWLKMVDEHIWEEDEPASNVITIIPPNRKSRRLGLQRTVRR